MVLQPAHLAEQHATHNLVAPALSNDAPAAWLILRGRHTARRGAPRIIARPGARHQRGMGLAACPVLADCNCTPHLRSSLAFRQRKQAGKGSRPA